MWVLGGIKSWAVCALSILILLCAEAGGKDGPFSLSRPLVVWGLRRSLQRFAAVTRDSPS